MLTYALSACAADDDEPRVSRTVVTLGADGTSHVSEDLITPADVALDPTCSGSSLVLYDRPNRTGNQLCFSGSAGGDLLGRYHRFVCTRTGVCYSLSWRGAVRSYAAGERAGYLAPFLSNPQQMEHFAAHQQVDLAGPIAQNADIVQLE